MSRLRTVGAAALLAVAVGLSGCDGGDVNGSSGGPAGDDVGPLAAQDVVRLDLRQAPTAQEAGIGPDRPDLILSRVGDAIDTQLQLPAGKLSLTAFRVNIGAPIGDTAPTYAGRIVVNVRSGDTAEVAALLLDQAPVLGIDPADVERWAARASTPKAYDNAVFEAPAPGPVGGPATYVEVRWEDSEQNWTLNYSFSFSGPPAADA